MDIFMILSMVGGLALFLYGMEIMSDALIKVSGGKLESILEKLTSKRIFALLLGAGVTAVIQSSSATTVMVVGFVNSGIMKLEQAVGIIMGANIGTTATSWILSLTGIQGDSVFIKMLKPSSFSPILAAIGIILVMTANDNMKKKNIGEIMLGFAVLMFGMEAMSSAVSPLKTDPTFTSMFTAFSNPVIGMLTGTILTAIIQSSSASVGILQALCTTGVVKFSAAIPIIMGQNIGTCITAIISSISGNRNAKRAAMIHLYFNLIGTIIFMVVFYTLNHFLSFAFLSMSASVTGIAIVHSLFNIGCSICLFPFANYLVKLATVSIPDKKEDPAKKKGPFVLAMDLLDERFLDEPGYAIGQCQQSCKDMLSKVKDEMSLVSSILKVYSNELVKEVFDISKEVCLSKKVIEEYMCKLSMRNVSGDEIMEIQRLMQVCGDFKRISDQLVVITKNVKDAHKQGIAFSDEGMEEVYIYTDAVCDIINRTIEVFDSRDVMKAKETEALGEVIESLGRKIKKRHFIRLQENVCTTEAGLVLENLINVLESVGINSNHVSTLLITQEEDDYFSPFVRDNSDIEKVWFKEKYRDFKKVYALPSVAETVKGEV